MATLYASTATIQARARTLDPVKMLVVVVSVIPWVLFGLARFGWLAVSLLVAAGMEGWDAADRRIAAQRADTRGG